LLFLFHFTQYQALFICKSVYCIFCIHLPNCIILLSDCCLAINCCECIYVINYWSHPLDNLFCNKVFHMKRCANDVSLLHAAITCLRGSRSLYHHFGLKESAAIDLVCAEGRICSFDWISYFIAIFIFMYVYFVYPSITTLLLLFLTLMMYLTFFTLLIKLQLAEMDKQWQPRV